MFRLYCSAAFVLLIVCGCSLDGSISGSSNIASPDYPTDITPVSLTFEDEEAYEDVCDLVQCISDSAQKADDFPMVYVRPINQIMSSYGFDEDDVTCQVCKSIKLLDDLKSDSLLSLPDVKILDYEGLADFLIDERGFVEIDRTDLEDFLGDLADILDHQGISADSLLSKWQTKQVCDALDSAIDAIDIATTYWDANYFGNDQYFVDERAAIHALGNTIGGTDEFPRDGDGWVIGIALLVADFLDGLEDWFEGGEGGEGTYYPPPPDPDEYFPPDCQD